MKEWYVLYILLCTYDTVDEIHNDVIKWKHVPRYWPCVRGIHRSPVNSPHTGQWRGALMFSLICALNKRLSKQSWCWWSETPSRSLWRHCNVSVLRLVTVVAWRHYCNTQYPYLCQHGGCKQSSNIRQMGLLIQTWINSNPSMDK